MARTPTSYLLDEEDERDNSPPIPWSAVIRARGATPATPPGTPLVGNASPAEVPGQSAEQYAQAAQKEKAKGNEDTAARLTVRATEAKAQESAAAGAPTPTTPLAPVAQGNAAAAPKMTMRDSASRGLDAVPWAYAMQRGTSGAPAPSQLEAEPAIYKPFEEPPEYKSPNKGTSFFALALDALLNKGRNAGRIVGQLAGGDDRYANYQRRMRAAKDAAELEATKRRGTARDLTPEELAYRDARLQIARDNLDVRKQQTEQQGESAALRAEQSAIKNDPAHPIAERVRANLYKQGVQPGSLDGMSLDAMKSGNNQALKNLVEQAQSTEMARVAAEKANAVANATDDNKIRVAEGISDATQGNKLELAQAAAATRQGEREAGAALDETKTINAERRKRTVNREKERATLESVLERLRKRQAEERLPAQGHFIERGIVKLRASAEGGTGMNEEDSLLDNDLTTAGLQAYITEANNAPNSEREQDNAGRKFRGDGTVGGAIAAIEAHLAKSQRAEEAIRAQEDAGRVHPAQQAPANRPKRAPAKRGPRRQDFEARGAAGGEVIPEDDLEIY
jgi:hypothetical protein